jgi:hypothetical protein
LTPAFQRSLNIGIRSVKPVASCSSAKLLVIDSGGETELAVTVPFSDVLLLP